MINFDQFIKAINDATLSANSALMDENLKVIDRYFESSGGTELITGSLDDALHAAKKILRKKRPTKEELEEAMQTFADAKEALQDDKGISKTKTSNALKPKTVVVQYPEQTSSGVVMKNVHVPLIALIPISSSQISEVRFKTNLEILVENDDLKVSFPTKDTEANTENNTQLQTSSLEIIMQPQKSPEGLKSLIQGYEKVLRAQIPN
ncbi:MULTISPECIES: DUF2589 domain-containing protein [Aquimarina]|uniref:DUF2589 domain-containing protein n=1 Tax=Aquimarina algiphila TaxID=2047982 RepID=A0A554VI21_9FLAO|nr:MULTISPECIES: DUF2589 domain-containing protein [Aquimarina]TSE07265.1 DUF2589 domain-containing protein [Aquimarina algiphila]